MAASLPCGDAIKGGRKRIPECTYPFSTLEHPGIDIAIKLQEPSRSCGHSLVPAFSVLDKIPQQVFLHRPGLSAADFPDGIDTGSDDLASYTRVHKLPCQLMNDGGDDVGRGEVVHRLRECDEDGRHAELVIREVLDDVRIESEHAELVGAHDTREQLHHDDFVFEGETLVVAVKQIVQLLSESLRVVEKLQSREVGRGDVRFLEVFLMLYG